MVGVHVEPDGTGVDGEFPIVVDLQVECRHVVGEMWLTRGLI